MKKSILFLACATLLASSAVAQDAATLFNQGKEAIAKFDKMSTDLMLAKAKDANAEDLTAAERAGYLMDGIKLLKQALPLDTIIEIDKKTGEPKIDKKTGKPKFKVKYSKEIQDILVSHINDLGSAGDNFFQTSDFANAFLAYGAYADALNSPLAKERQFVLPDSVFGQILFMQAYSAYMIKDFQSGYDLSKKSMALGFNKFGVGDVKNSCVANIIQNYINEKNYDSANVYIDNVLMNECTGFNMDIKGFIVEQEKGLQAAADLYKKAIELDPNFGNSYFDYGRVLYDKAQKIIEAKPNATDKELAPELVPIYTEAIEIFGKAKELAPDTQAARFIEDIDYKLELLGAKK